MAFAPGGGATRTGRGTREPGNGTRRGPSSKASAPEAKRPSVTFLAGLGVGLALGAAAALLLAPQSGAETRRSLRSRGRKVGNRARDAWEDLRIELEATRRALKRKRRDAKVEIEQAQAT